MRKATQKILSVRPITQEVVTVNTKNTSLREPTPTHWPLFVLGKKRPIHYLASVLQLPHSIAIIMYGK